MIQLVNVAKRFGHKLLFEDLGWHIRGDERLGLVGPNGAGKTTLLRIIAGRLETDGGQVVKRKGIRVGLLDQEQDFSGSNTVLQEVEQASDELETVKADIARLESQLGDGDASLLERYGQLQDRFEALGGYTAEAEAKQVLCGLGFTEAELYSPASRFSGGWRMRISLARLLLQKPDVLLLDEPTNHLDLESIAWLESHIANYEGAVVVVSHDRYYLNRACKHIAELNPRGVRIYTGNYDRYLVLREQERELLEKQFKQQQREIEKTEKFIERFRYKNTKATAVQSRVKALDKIDRIELMPTTRSMRGFAFPQPPRSGRVVAELSQLTKAWDDNVVYENLDLMIERGWRIALVGVNGAGKSTLLKILAEETPITSGERRLGHNVTVGYFGQHQLESLNTKATVMAEMEAVSDIDTYPLVRGILGAFLFSGEDVKKLVGVLSGGEKARLAIARMLLRPRTMLLLDEPTSHLDLESRSSLEDALKRYSGTMVVVSHDRYFINEVCTHVLEIDRGTATWYPGNYEEYQWKKAQEDAALGIDDAALLRTSSGLVDKGQKLPGVRDDDRARKRREAEVRQAVYKATHSLKKRLDANQSEIEALEAALQEVDEQLADPAAYAAGGKGQELAIRRGEIEAQVSDLYEKWERIEAEIEAATEAASADIP